MGAAEFVAFQRHVYGVVKSANPTIRWGPVYMAYWWDPATPSHWVGDPKAWWPGDGYADFAAVDWYAPRSRPMTTSPSFRTWYQVMARTGVPLYITEYGQYAVPSGSGPIPRRSKPARPPSGRTPRGSPTIRGSAMWIYWQAVGDQGDWRLRGRGVRKRAWREVAAAGCSRRAGAAVAGGAD